MSTPVQMRLHQRVFRRLLTSFRRHVTPDAETVGGPIDVAVISRGDGFIWIKRKHYFQPELNQHFFANYFRGVSNGEREADD